MHTPARLPFKATGKVVNRRDYARMSVRATPFPPRYYKIIPPDVRSAIRARHVGSNMDIEHADYPIGNWHHAEEFGSGDATGLMVHGTVLSPSDLPEGKRDKQRELISLLEKKKVYCSVGLEILRDANGKPHVMHRETSLVLRPELEGATAECQLRFSGGNTGGINLYSPVIATQSEATTAPQTPPMSDPASQFMQASLESGGDTPAVATQGQPPADSQPQATAPDAAQEQDFSDLKDSIGEDLLKTLSPAQLNKLRESFNAERQRADDAEHQNKILQASSTNQEDALKKLRAGDLDMVEQAYKLSKQTLPEAFKEQAHKVEFMESFNGLLGVSKNLVHTTEQRNHVAKENATLRAEVESWKQRYNDLSTKAARGGVPNAEASQQVPTQMATGGKRRREDDHMQGNAMDSMMQVGQVQAGKKGHNLLNMLSGFSDIAPAHELANNPLAVGFLEVENTPGFSAQETLLTALRGAQKSA